MSYTRVLPRDLFNEANLLKCVGALWIATENKDNVKFNQDDVEFFDVRQSDDDGSITIENVSLSIKGETYHARRPLNSREPWPLYLLRRYDPDYDEIPVFKDDGTLSDEFRALIV